jgi:dephospho-CoA kinase
MSPGAAARSAPARLTLVVKVGLTGGIGSGKSEVARRLSALGAVVVDADALAREAVEPGTRGLAAVVEEFGPEVLRPDGSLDRGALGRLVFTDESARHRLEAIVHPVVAARSAELMAGAADDAVVVYDVPLLVEKHLEGDYDLVVVVEASLDVRVNRVVEHRGMDRADVESRIHAQSTPEERAAVADVVVDNSGDLETLQPQVEDLWARLTSWCG